MLPSELENVLEVPEIDFLPVFLSRTVNPSLGHQVIHVLLQVFNATPHFFQYKVKESRTWDTGT